MKISMHIRNLWREVEDILTAATGPLLIVSSAISTSDIFSNSTFSHLIPQLPAIWAIGRALAVTMWLGIAFEFYLEARRRGESGSWWFLLSMVLFAVDLQTATLFAFQAEHISALGEWAILKIPPIDWAIEQATLGVILIAVHRAVIHQEKPAVSNSTVTTQFGVRPNMQQSVAAQAPRASRAYWDGTIAPIAVEDDPTTYTPSAIEFVSDEEPPQTPTGVTRNTSKRRSDSGHSPMDSATKKAHLHSMLRDDPAMSLGQIEKAIEVTRPTAVKYRDEIRRALWQQFPKRRAEFRTAWGESWSESV